MEINNEFKENLCNAGFNKKEADKINFYIENDEYLDMMDKHHEELPTDNSLSDIISDIDLINKIDKYRYPNSEFCYYDQKEKKVKWIESEYENAKDLIHKYHIIKKKYNSAELEVIETIATIYNCNGIFNKDSHVLDSSASKYKETMFNVCYDNLGKYIWMIDNGYYNVSNNVKKLLKSCIDDYKINKHKNAGRPQKNRMIVCIDPATNEVIERYTSIQNVIDRNPDEKMTKAGISQVLNGKRSKYRGLIFKYIDLD